MKAKASEMEHAARSSSAVVSFSSPKTWTHSEMARFVVTIVERRS